MSGLGLDTVEIPALIREIRESEPLNISDRLLKQRWHSLLH